MKLLPRFHLMHHFSRYSCFYSYYPTIGVTILSRLQDGELFWWGSFSSFRLFAMKLLPRFSLDAPLFTSFLLWLPFYVSLLSQLKHVFLNRALFATTSNHAHVFFATTSNRALEHNELTDLFNVFCSAYGLLMSRAFVLNLAEWRACLPGTTTGLWDFDPTSLAPSRASGFHFWGLGPVDPNMQWRHAST